MTSCHLIKDDNGRIAGYVLRENGRLRICLNSEKEQSSVFISDGREETVFSIHGNALEKEVEWTGEQIEYVRLEPYADGEKTECDLSPVQTDGSSLQIKETENYEELCKKEEALRVYIENEKLETDFPFGKMNRWPPPPCWSTARYINGAWRERRD